MGATQDDQPRVAARSSEERWRIIGALVVGLSILTPGVARADADPADVAPASTDVVEVVVVGTEDDLELLKSVVGPQDFGSATARWMRRDKLKREELLERRPAVSDVAVRCFVGIRPGRANLYFANRTAERFLVREVPLPHGLDAAGREAVAQVLSLSVTALIADAEGGLTRSETERLLGEPAEPPHPSVEPEPEPAPPEPEPEPSGEASSSLGAAPYYSVKLFSREVPWVHGPGFAVAWVTGGPRAFAAVWLSADYEVPERYHQSDVGVAWETTGFRAAFELSRAVTSVPFIVGARFGAGIDVVRFSPKGGTASANVALTDARTVTVPAITPALIVGVPLGARFSLGLEAFADILPVALSYELAAPTGNEAVLRPYRVRPGAALRLMLR